MMSEIGRYGTLIWFLLVIHRLPLNYRVIYDWLSFRTEHVPRKCVIDTVDRAVSPIRSTEYGTDRKARSKSLTAVDCQRPPHDSRLQDADLLQQKLHIADERLDDLRSALSAKVWALSDKKSYSHNVDAPYTLRLWRRVNWVVLNVATAHIMR